MDNQVFVYFDACFLAQIYRVDKTCGLTDLIKDAFYKKCIYDPNQKGNCSNISISCSDVNTLIDDDEVFEFTLNYPKNKRPLANIYNPKTEAGDLTDLRILAFAYKSGDCHILSCDRNLLMLCNELDIYHLCFKAALVRLDNFFDGEIFKSSDYETAQMFEKHNDPFFNFGNNKRCQQCCKKVCDFQNPGSQPSD